MTREARMSVPEAGHTDSSKKIQVPMAIDVDEPTAVTVTKGQSRQLGDALDPGSEVPLFFGNPCARPRPGHRFFVFVGYIRR